MKRRTSVARFDVHGPSPAVVIERAANDAISPVVLRFRMQIFDADARSVLQSKGYRQWRDIFAANDAAKSRDEHGIGVGRDKICAYEKSSVENNVGCRESRGGLDQAVENV